MGRAVMALLLVASVVHADPAKWTLPLGADWQDVSGEAATRAGVVAQRKLTTDAGGTFDLTAYKNSANGAEVTVKTAELPSIPATPEGLAELEAKLRSGTSKGVTEVSYTKDITASSWAVTQRVSGPEMAGALRSSRGVRGDDDLGPPHVGVARRRGTIFIPSTCSARR